MVEGKLIGNDTPKMLTKQKLTKHFVCRGLCAALRVVEKREGPHFVLTAKSKLGGLRPLISTKGGDVERGFGAGLISVRKQGLAKNLEELILN
jgi:hypothetical protein